MERDLKHALMITAAVFAVLIGYGILTVIY